MKLDIKSNLIPGTVIEKEKIGNITGCEFLDKIFFITDGIMLSQIREICAIDGSTLQNWTKRGWVPSPKNKKYNKNQLARILIINMMRETMQLDKIAQVLSYVNGKVEDTGDDIIPESELYGYLCVIIDHLVEDELPPDAENMQDLIARTLCSYVERIAGATKRLQKACSVIILSYYAALVRQKANIMYADILEISEIK